MKKFLILDTFNFLHRAYHALPNVFTDTNGEPTNAVYGVTSMLINVLTKLKPDYVVAALDGPDPTFRVENFTGYKAHRKPPELEFSSQIPKAIEVLQAFGITTLQVNGYEADDIIGSLTKKWDLSQFGSPEFVVISNDRDLWQLVNGSVRIAVPNKLGGLDYIDKPTCIAKLGFEPKYISDYKGLRGDPSDNIPGVYGIGEKTATQLIKDFGTLENIYANLGKIKPESVKTKLIECAETATMSKELARIILDVPFTLNINECEYNGFDKEKVLQILQKYHFKSLIKRLGLGDAISPNSEKNGSKSKKDEPLDNQLSLL